MSDVMQIDGLYRIIPLKQLRKTQSVDFDALPVDQLEGIQAVDRVMHGAGAFSPGTVGDVERPWYMHTHQIDHLIVMHGLRNVDLYTKAHGRVKKFEVTPEAIRSEGEDLYEGPALLSWPTGVFHRVISGENGSASINFATHLDGFDIRTNFNIYALDTSSGECRTIREGHLDQ